MCLYVWCGACLCLAVCEFAGDWQRRRLIHRGSELPVLKKYIITFQMCWMSPWWSMGNIIQSDRCGTCQNNTTGVWQCMRGFRLFYLSCSLQCTYSTLTNACVSFAYFFYLWACVYGESRDNYIINEPVCVFICTHVSLYHTVCVHVSCQCVLYVFGVFQCTVYVP